MSHAPQLHESARRLTISFWLHQRAVKWTKALRKWLLRQKLLQKACHRFSINISNFFSRQARMQRQPMVLSWLRCRQARTMPAAPLQPHLHHKTNLTVTISTSRHSRRHLALLIKSCNVRAAWILMGKLTSNSSSRTTLWIHGREAILDLGRMLQSS